MELKDIVIEELKKYTDADITLSSLIKEDLNIDSYKALNVLVKLDSKGITFKNGKIDYINTVEDLIKSLEFKK